MTKYCFFSQNKLLWISFCLEKKWAEIQRDYSPVNFHIEVWILTMLRMCSAKTDVWYTKTENHMHASHCYCILSCCLVSPTYQHFKFLILSTCFAYLFTRYHNINFYLLKQPLFRENNCITKIIVTFLFTCDKVSSAVLT